MCWTELEIKKYFKKCMGMATRQTCETASPWLAELPAAGKPDAETEKQPWLSVWTTLKQAGPFLLRANSLFANNTAERDQRIKASLNCPAV